MNIKLLKTKQLRGHPVEVFRSAWYLSCQEGVGQAEGGSYCTLLCYRLRQIGAVLRGRSPSVAMHALGWGGSESVLERSCRLPPPQESLSGMRDHGGRCGEGSVRTATRDDY